MNAITQAIEKAEGFVTLGIGEDAWETLEDLPTEAKNIPRVLELRLEALVCLHNWQMAEILGDSLAAIMPASVSVWWSLARVRASLGQRETALDAIGRVTALDASKRLEMLDDPLLASVW
jgi:hypothetical protein